MNRNENKWNGMNGTSGTSTPALTAGDILPVVMMDFENAAEDFFIAKSVPADKQAVMVIPGLKDI